MQRTTTSIDFNCQRIKLFATHKILSTTYAQTDTPKLSDFPPMYGDVGQYKTHLRSVRIVILLPTR